MNPYGAIAEKHYRQFLPDRYQLIPDPTEFFNQLGTEIADQIEELEVAFAGEDQPDEGYLAKVGRLNAARQMARERVLAEMLPDPEAELVPTES